MPQTQLDAFKNHIDTHNKREKNYVSSYDFINKNYNIPYRGIVIIVGLILGIKSQEGNCGKNPSTTPIKKTGNRSPYLGHCLHDYFQKIRAER